MVTCPNEHPYLVMLTVEAHEEHQLKRAKVPAIRVGVAMKSVEKDGSLSEHEKFKTATVWLDRSNHRLPLEIRAEVFVGSVRVVLESYAELDNLQQVVEPGSNADGLVSKSTGEKNARPDQPPADNPKVSAGGVD